MCGRFTLAPAAGRLFAPRFGLSEDAEVGRRWNIAPSTSIPVVTRRESANRLDWMHWGLVPHWADSPKVGAKMINARAETLTERPSYRGLLEGRRCLVPADGFYEWQQQGGGAPKQPYFFSRDGEEFAFAGLWTTWSPGEGVEALESVTIITTEPGPDVAPVHGRMPAILDDDRQAAWLGPSTSRDEALALLGPLPEGSLRAVPVSTWVNSVANDGPQCCRPLEEGADDAAAEA